MTDGQHVGDCTSDDNPKGRPAESRIHNLGEMREKAAAGSNDVQSVVPGLRAFRKAWREQVQRSVRPAIDSMNSTAKAVLQAAGSFDAGMARWQRSVAIPMAGIRRSFQFSGFDRQLRPVISQVVELLNRIPSVEEIERRILTEEGPDNWTELRDSHDLRQLLKIAEDGIPVTWVPRAAILAELIGVEPDHRESCLLSWQEDILDDCDAVLSGLQEGFGEEQARLLKQAIYVQRLGQFAPAQALAASIVDTVLRTAVLPPSARYYPKVKDQIGGMSLALLPWAVTHWPVLPALENFNGQSDEPTPARFNRHATAHQADLTQFTTVNALIALMLATSMLREARHVEDEVVAMADTDGTE